MDYRYGSHTVFKIQYHFVCVTKYTYQILQGDVGVKGAAFKANMMASRSLFMTIGIFAVASVPAVAALVYIAPKSRLLTSDRVVISAIPMPTPLP